MHYTVEQVYAWIEENAGMLADKLQQEPNIDEEMKQVGHKFPLAFSAGEWIWQELEKNRGATRKEASAAAFCVGQWGLFEDPVAKAVEYANEYFYHGEIEDKPGDSLARVINEKHLGTPEQRERYFKDNPKALEKMEAIKKKLRAILDKSAKQSVL